MKGIYILTNRINGKQYVGRDSQLGQRARKHLSLKTQECPLIHNAIKKHGAAAFDVQLRPYPGISHEALNAIEKWHIAKLGTQKPNGYNVTEGGEGLDSETARRNAHKRLANGTHPFCNLDRADHREQARRNAHKRLEDGTHNFLDPELRRCTPQVVRRNAHKRLANGTHNFLDPETGRRGGRRNAHKRLEDGTHHFLDPETGRRGGRRSAYMRKLKGKATRRELYRIYAVLLTSKSVIEAYRHRQLTRDGFFDKEIPDTSQSQQLSLI